MQLEPDAILERHWQIVLACRSDLERTKHTLEVQQRKLATAVRELEQEVKARERARTVAV